MGLQSAAAPAAWLVGEAAGCGAQVAVNSTTAADDNERRANMPLVYRCRRRPGYKKILWRAENL